MVHQLRSSSELTDKEQDELEAVGREAEALRLDTEMDAALAAKLAEAERMQAAWAAREAAAAAAPVAVEEEEPVPTQGTLMEVDEVERQVVPRSERRAASSGAGSMASSAVKVSPVLSSGNDHD